MAAVLLNASVIAAVKTALLQTLPAIKSSHLSEALAFGLGFKTNRSLQAAVVEAGTGMQLVVPDDEAFLKRASELGYPSIPWKGFDDFGKSFASSDLLFVYPEKVLETMGWMQMDLYYCAVMLQEAGQQLPGYLSVPSLESKLVLAGLRTGKFTTVNLADYMRITRVFDGSDCDDDGAPLGPIKSGDDYVGVVSFRSDAPVDSEFLFERLGDRFPGKWRRDETSSEDNTSVQLTISRPLTIQALHKVMKEIPDGHITVETLRALPLDENNLHRRYSQARPRDWASLDDDDLNEEDTRAEEEAEERDRQARRQARTRLG